MNNTALISAISADQELRADDLRNTLSTMAIEGHYLDEKSLAIYHRYVCGQIDLETVGRLFNDVIYSRNPSARIDA